MIGMEEGLLPHQRSLYQGGTAIAEERRLAYVGVTRAQDFLTLSLAKQRMKWGKPRASIVSRFLLEMRGETEKAEKVAEASHQKLVLEAPKVDTDEPANKKKTKKKARGAVDVQKRATRGEAKRAATAKAAPVARRRVAAQPNAALRAGAKRASKSDGA
jgi:ATP-dependent exoDNAse (exonuclease V) beta subunit